MCSEWMFIDTINKMWCDVEKSGIFCVHIKIKIKTINERLYTCIHHKMQWKAGSYACSKTYPIHQMTFYSTKLYLAIIVKDIKIVPINIADETSFYCCKTKNVWYIFSITVEYPLKAKINFVSKCTEFMKWYFWQYHH